MFLCNLSLMRQSMFTLVRLSLISYSRSHLTKLPVYGMAQLNDILWSVRKRLSIPPYMTYMSICSDSWNIHRMSKDKWEISRINNKAPNLCKTHQIILTSRSAVFLFRASTTNIVVRAITSCNLQRAMFTILPLNANWLEEISWSLITHKARQIVCL